MVSGLCADSSVYPLPASGETGHGLRGLEGLARAGFIGLIKLIREKTDFHYLEYDWNFGIREARWSQLARWAQLATDETARWKKQLLEQSSKARHHIIFDSDWLQEKCLLGRYELMAQCTTNPRSVTMNSFHLKARRL